MTTGRPATGNGTRQPRLARSRSRKGNDVLHLSSGVRLDGDEEIVFRTVDLEQAGGDGLYVADIAESAGLPEHRVRDVVAALVTQDVLAEGAHDDQLGARYVKGRAV